MGRGRFVECPAQLRPKLLAAYVGVSHDDEEFRMVMIVKVLFSAAFSSLLVRSPHINKHSRADQRRLMFLWWLQSNPTTDRYYMDWVGGIRVVLTPASAAHTLRFHCASTAQRARRWRHE